MNKPGWSADRFTGAAVPPRWGTPITILVPIHDAAEATRECLDSVFQCTRHPHRVLLVDDASEDERLRSHLDELVARHEHVSLIRNPTRLGYTASVQLGCDSVSGDVVLLNSDTIVTLGWLGRLAQVARSQRNVATVTAVSNAAGAFSVPIANVENHLPHGMSVQDMADLVARVSPRAIPRTPTGNGFCMYVSRLALDRTGGFDVAAFPDGYAEENDFCLRASAKGFIHLVDDRTYIFHRRSASYGERRGELLHQNLQRLSERHPDYAQATADWRATDDLGLLRSRLARAIRRGRPDASPGRDEAPLLIVTNQGFGGVQHTTRDLIGDLSATFPCVELVTGLREWTVRETPASSGEREQVIRFSTPWNIAFPMDAARVEALRRICKRFGIRLAHIRHFLGNAPEIVDVLQGLEIPTVFSVHDFYTVCPTVKLIDEQGQHCGGRCTDGKGDCPGEDRYAHQFPFLKHRYVNEWRRRTSRALAGCQALLTTSAHVQELLVQAMPELSDSHWEIIEHGRDIQAYRDCCGPPDEGRPTVLFFGQLTAAKGADVLRRLCELNHDAGSPFDMQFLGTPVDDPERFPGATWHGPYQRDELPGRLASIRPSITLIPSQWPETWCHVLTEAWAAGVPVMASDTGALADRLRREGGGWLVSRASDAQVWFDELRRVLLTRSSDYPMQRATARSHVPTSPRQMAERYLSVYRLLLEPAPARGGLPAGGSSDSSGVGTEGGMVEEPPAMRSE